LEPDQVGRKATIAVGVCRCGLVRLHGASGSVSPEASVLGRLPSDELVDQLSRNPALITALRKRGFFNRAAWRLNEA
jgi:hypothetical protein